MIRVLLICLCAFLCSTVILAQAVLTNDGVIEMVKSGLSPVIIVAKIKSSESKFDTTTEGLKKLTVANVPDSVIVAMIDRENEEKKEEKTESTANSKVSDSIPEQGNLSDLIGKTKVYVFSPDLKSRDKIIKVLEKNKSFDVVDKVEDSEFVIKFESWEETVGATGNVIGNTATVTQNRVRIGVLTVLMPSAESNRVRLVYSNKQTQRSWLFGHPAEKTTKKFLKALSDLK